MARAGKIGKASRPEPSRRLAHPREFAYCLPKAVNAKRQSMAKFRRLRFTAAPMPIARALPFSDEDFRVPLRKSKGGHPIVRRPAVYANCRAKQAGRVKAGGLDSAQSPTGTSSF